ncbi:MAG TPA: coenzyme F420-0:L-glutamate ligase [Candidatus Sulfotelmatobacter sp.]|jgi:coenzyme F420-0:L-glutamate ligase / coenzyme F420-1:gamma-L-glutamate ligase|nr:coenzyme F420-0:L-glutamate ligase [Candidatus Sulfotelmatobacter sp.]
MKKVRSSKTESPASRREELPSASLGQLHLIPILLADEVQPGDSLADKLLEALRRRRLKVQSGDILVVKHKIVSKSEGRVVDLATIAPSAESVAWAKQYGLDARVIELAVRESSSVIRRRNGVLITETRQGFLCANSGVDVSNVNGGGHALLLPEDADRSAASLRRKLKQRTGFAIPVIITDSFGRPWREGLTEFAIGIAGMKPLRDDRGRRDPHGYKLRASVEAVADELACAAGLVCGKLNRAPACIVRGFRYEAGAGRVRELLRPPSTDLFR